MTDTAISAAPAPGALPAHPLAPVTGPEFRAGREILAAAGLLAEPVRFAYYGLEEPPTPRRSRRGWARPPTSTCSGHGWT
jgi:hypothetical protein